MHIKRKTVLGILLACAFLVGSFISPVAALQTNSVEESFNYGFGAGANNHTYVYASPDNFNFISSSSMYLNEDIDMTYYGYESNGWASPDASYSGDQEMYFNFPYSNCKF